MSTNALSTVKGQVGPQGPSGYTTLVHPAGVAIGGHRVVYIDSLSQVQYASSDMPSHSRKVVGITTGAGSVATPINIQVNGEIEEMSWNWNINAPIYLGINGALTQVVPETGFILIVAQPITNTKILVSIREPIILI